MKKTSSMGPGRRLLVAAIAALAPLSAAQAREFIAAATSGEFQRAAAQGPALSEQAAMDDVDRHAQVNALGWHIVIYPAPAGAQGPIRGEEDQATAAREAEQKFWRDALGPLGSDIYNEAEYRNR